MCRVYTHPACFNGLLDSDCILCFMLPLARALAPAPRLGKHFCEFQKHVSVCG